MLKRQTRPAVYLLIIMSWRKSRELPRHKSRRPSFTAASVRLKDARMQTRTWHVWLSLLSAASVCAITLAGVKAADLNDYPTAARADYIFGCMKANGDTRIALEQCSCSIDIIATLLPYDRYSEAEAVLSLSQVQGRFGAMFRSTEPAKAAVNDLRRAQAEAEVRCF